MGILPGCHRENFGRRLPYELQAAAVLPDAGSCAGVDDRGRDGSVHDALLRLLLARLSLGEDDMVIPCVECWAWLEVAVPLIVSSCADLCHLGANVDDAEVGDVRLRFLVGE